LKYRLTTIKQKLEHRESNLLGHESMKKSAVLVPLIERDGETHILFEVRAKQLRTQPGEICFPGGGVEAMDQDAAETAVRETCEELGLTERQVKVVAPLDHLATAFQFVIYPYVGVILEPEAIAPNEKEVETIFTVPLEYLLTHEPKLHYVHLRMQPDDSFPFHLIPRGKRYNWRTGRVPEYFYFYENFVIWGLTARILTHFLDELRK